MMVYVDMDNTLLDSIKRIQAELHVIASYGFDDTLYWNGVDAAFEKHGISNFGYEVLFEACKMIRPELPDEVLSGWKKIGPMLYLYSDAIEFLEQIPKERLSLLTTGNEHFQRKKIAAHGLERYFFETNINIVPSPKGRHIVPKANAIYIDDSPREIDAMKLARPHVFCILVRQPAPWEQQKTSLFADARCPDLLSTIAHIRQRMMF